MALSVTLTRLRRANKGLVILDARDRAFEKYGRVLKGVKPTKALALAKKQKPGAGIVYQASVKGLEADARFLAQVRDRFYGGMPIQIGWCFGFNSLLNAVEYHKGIEVDMAVTDCICVVGDERDINWQGRTPTYSSSKAEIFYLPAGTLVELHPWCLHYAPVHVRSRVGFCTIVCLPKATNTEGPRLRNAKGEERILLKRNKWLLAHKAAAGLAKAGAVVGITGANLKVNPIS